MNPMDLMKNFQNLQSRMKDIQDKVRDITVSGTAGGDMVRIEMNGAMEVLSVRISPEAVDPADIPMLQDLVLAAFSDAMAKIRDRLQEEMSELTGGLNLPPGFPGL